VTRTVSSENGLSVNVLIFKMRYSGLGFLINVSISNFHRDWRRWVTVMVHCITAALHNKKDT